MFRYLTSTIGRKQIVGLSGLGFALFLLVHMAGNTLMFISAQAYNEYAYHLELNPLLELAEVLLAATFIVHALLALRVQYSNWRSRPQGYAVAASGPKKTTMVQKTLWAQGILILVFVVLHLVTFKFGEEYTITYGTTQMRDLFRLLVEKFQQPGYVFFYVLCLAIMFSHLSHGVQSAVRTLGFNHPAYEPKIRILGWGYAILVSFGFMAQPIYILFFYKG